ncbi:hypothetical protein A3218_05795 [Pseudomonas chlororaphis]|nr:hypothetical protein A3218_05795 [Pseudomonas chlororaphis]
MFFALAFRWCGGFYINVIACRLVIKHVNNTHATGPPIQNVFFIWIAPLRNFITEKTVIKSFVFIVQFFRQGTVIMFIIYIIVIAFI